MPKLSVYFLLLLACGTPTALAVAQSFSVNRMIIATKVACRDQPNVSSATVGSFGLGDQIVASEASEVNGETWYHVRSKVALSQEFDPSSRPWDCWVFGSLTTSFDSSDPEPALVALADHALNNEAASFEDLVDVENVLAASSMADIVASSARLQARRLRVIELALTRLSNRREPLVRSWVQSHEDLLEYWSIGRTWYIPLEVYWRVYESFEGRPGAEEIAWASANARVFFDECYTTCRLDLIRRTRMQYWRRFPSGRHVEEALTFAVDQAGLAGRYCILGVTGYLQMDFASVRILVDELRSSLDAVNANGRDSFSMWLDEIERDCLNSQVSDLNDPLAIPGLARAFGSGFSIVPRQLAGFGEEALPAVLQAMRTPGLETSVVEHGLLALRYMVELQDVRPLSAGALEEIRAVAEQWLAMPEQSILTLGHAIDIAVVLGDSDLRQIVQSLANDRDEVYARGVEAERSVELIQRRAAERLAGNPPLPRP